MKMRHWLWVTIMLPKVLMLDWTQTPTQYMELFLTTSGEHMVYYELYSEPVEVLDYPCTDSNITE